MLQKLLDKINYALDTIFMNNASDDVKWWKRYIWFIALAVVLGMAMLADVGLALGLLGFGLLFLYIPYCLLRVAISRDRRKMYGQRAGIALLLMIVSLAGESQLLGKNASPETAKNIVQEQKVAEVSPEQKAYDDQAKYEEWIKYQEDQKLQEAYDNQAKYEEWIKYQEDQKLQEVYDNQAKYEEWLAWKQQKAYDDQAAYEEWIAWQQQNTPEALIKKNVYGINSLEINDNGDGSYSVTISENAVIRTSNDVVKYETVNDHKLHQANVLEQCRSVVKGIQNSGVPVSDVTINLIDDVSDGDGYISKGNIVVCNVPGDADCKDIYVFQNYLNRFWMINGL